MKTIQKSENLSIVTGALEEVYSSIREKTGAPKATIVIGRAKGKHGHFTPYTPWQSGEEQFHEIFLTAESFNRGAVATLGTLLHEASHAINNKAGIKDASREGYHNKEFKKTAEALGLEIENAGGNIGWSKTIVPMECCERWAEELEKIEHALSLVALSGEEGKPKGRNKNLIVAMCECENKIRLSQQVLDASRPMCQECETEFVKA